MPVPADRRYPLAGNVPSLRLVPVARPRQRFLELRLDQALDEMPDLIPNPRFDRVKPVLKKLGVRSSA